jgi:3-oxoadipate enol-lactonase
MTVPRLTATPHPSLDGGPLLLLGPGLGADSAILWEAAIPALAERFRVVTWDLPGHGRSPAHDEPLTLADLADAVDALRAELGAATALHAGVSIGGGVSLELGLRHPDTFTRVALVCSNFRFGDPNWPDTWLERAATVRASGTAALKTGSVGRWFTPESVLAHSGQVTRLLAGLEAADDATYARCCEALAAFDFSDRLAAVTVPVLDVWCERDETISRAAAEHVVATVPDGRLAVIVDAAHFGPVDQPAAIAAALLDFFG